MNSAAGQALYQSIVNEDLESVNLQLNNGITNLEERDQASIILRKELYQKESLILVCLHLLNSNNSLSLASSSSPVLDPRHFAAMGVNNDIYCAWSFVKSTAPLSVVVQVIICAQLCHLSLGYS